MIEKLNHYALTNPASVYDEEALTALELAGRTASKVNESIGAYNKLEEETHTRLDNQEQKQIPNTIKQEVQNQINNGTFDKQINKHIGNLEERVDSLLGTLSAGSTTRDAEVIDIRTGVNGKVYTNAGEAVREQISELNETLDYAPILRVTGATNNLINYMEIIKNAYIGTNGVENTGTDAFHCTPFIKVTPNTYYKFLQCGLSAWYDANKNFVSSFTPGSGCFLVPENVEYIRISLPVEYSAWCMFIGERDLKNDEGVPTITTKPYENGYIPFTVKVNQLDTPASAFEGQEDLQTNLVDVNCRIWLSDKSYTPYGKPAPLLMLIHGAGQGVETWKDNTFYDAFVKDFSSQGYCVFDCNGFKNDALGYSYWGNMRGVEAYRKAYDYVVNNYNVEKDVNIYAFSMGGLTAMNLVCNNFPNVKCMALGSPVLSMEACWNDTSVQSVLRTLYNIPSGVTEYEDKYFIGVNPYKRILNINGVNLFNGNLPPLKIWFGSKETGASTNTGTGENVNGAVNKQYAIDLVNAIQNSGGYALYRECPGYSHDICYGSTQFIKNEIIIFLNRFNYDFIV